MEAQRWRTISRLCHEALDRSPEERRSFLDTACLGDEALRREVESLLEQAASAGALSAGFAPLEGRESPTDMAASPLTGRRIGAYEVHDLIAVGGMGAVYRARDTRLMRDVAIKILPPLFTMDPERLMRFQREARVLAALNHPNIATIHGIEKANHIHAIVLEFIEGDTLADRIGRGPIPLDNTLKIARQLADALEAAHEKGFIHRDLKPANIKITSDGTVKVLDFGLAKIAAGALATDPAEPTLSFDGTRDGRVIGTAAYMSPEQARGQTVDKRTDIWAFGCVLYEMLTGRPTFSGETVSDIIAGVLERPPKWSVLPPETPAAVTRLLGRCLERNLSRRLRDIADARLDIEEADSARVQITASVTGAAKSKREIEFRRLTDLVGMKESPAVSPDGKMVAFVALVGNRRQICIRMLAGGAPLQVTHDDVDHEQPRWAPDSSAIIYFSPGPNRDGLGTIWEIGTLGGLPRRVTRALSGGDISHDGQRIAVVQSTGGRPEVITVARDGSRKQCVVVLAEGDVYSMPRWAPDDSAIAFQRTGGVRFFDMRLEVVAVTNGERREVARADRLQGFSWLPDGSGLIYSSSYGSTLLYPPAFNLRMVRTADGQNQQLTFGDVSYVDPDVDSAGRLVAGRLRGQSDIWRFPVTGTPADNMRNAVRITRQTGLAQTPSVSPDGAELVYLSDNGGHGNLWVIRTDATGLRQITFERDAAVAMGMPVWSPDGNHIAFITERGDQIGVSVIEPDGCGLRELVRSGWAPCWSADGQWLYYSVARDGSQHIEKVHVDGGEPIAVRSDAGWSAVGSNGGTLFFVRWLRSQFWGTWGEAEIHAAAMAGNGPTQVLAKIPASRVPLWPFTHQWFASPDGRWLAAPLKNGATTNIWVLPVTGEPMRAVTDFGDRAILIARSVSWSADSQHLYAAVAESETDIVLLDGLLG
jgi:eukaryotic-like serine/threonine-protein kinase